MTTTQTQPTKSVKQVVKKELTPEQIAKNKEFRDREVGALWIKENLNGKFFSIEMEEKNEFGIETKRKFFAYPNRFKEQGDNKPDFRILISREEYEQKVNKIKALEEKRNSKIQKSEKTATFKNVENPKDNNLPNPQNDNNLPEESDDCPL